MADQTITRDQFKYWKTIEVRWGDMDSQGHVNNAVYFTYLESARVELVRKIGFKGKQGGEPEGLALVSASCDFKRQVVYPATLDVGLRVERIGRRSFEMSYGIFIHGTDQLDRFGSQRKRLGRIRGGASGRASGLVPCGVG